MSKELLQPIRGIIPPLVTPLTTDDKLDVEGLRRLIEHQIAGGVHGLFLLGTTGEGPSLSLEVRRDTIRHASEIVDSRLPLLVAITDSSLEESLELANFAANYDIAAVVAAPPFYFEPSQSDLVAYFQELNARLPLPLVLYNMPATTGLVLEPATVGQLLTEESIVGLKDSSGDLDYFRKVIELTAKRPDFPILVGPEHLLAETIALGGQGGVTGGANVWPQPFVALYNAALEGDTAAIARCTEQVTQLGKIYRVGPFSIPGIIARTKAALEILGVCDRNTAPPISAAPAAEVQAINAILQQVGISPQSANELSQAPSN